MTQQPPQQMPRGHGTMIVMGKTATVFGEPGHVHALFMAQIQHWHNEWVKDGRPESGSLM